MTVGQPPSLASSRASRGYDSLSQDEGTAHTAWEGAALVGAGAGGEVCFRTEAPAGPWASRGGMLAPTPPPLSRSPGWPAGGSGGGRLLVLGAVGEGASRAHVCSRVFHVNGREEVGCRKPTPAEHRGLPEQSVRDGGLRPAPWFSREARASRTRQPLPGKQGARSARGCGPERQALARGAPGGGREAWSLAGVLGEARQSRAVGWWGRPGLGAPYAAAEMWT